MLQSIGSMMTPAISLARSPASAANASRSFQGSTMMSLSAPGDWPGVCPTGTGDEAGPASLGEGATLMKMLSSQPW